VKVVGIKNIEELIALLDGFNNGGKKDGLSSSLPPLNIKALGRKNFFRELRRRFMMCVDGALEWSEIEAAIATNLMIGDTKEFLLSMLLKGGEAIRDHVYSVSDVAALRFARKMFGPDVSIKIKLQPDNGGWTTRLDHGLPESGGGGSIVDSKLGLTLPQSITLAVIHALLAIEEAKPHG